MARVPAAENQVRPAQFGGARVSENGGADTSGFARGLGQIQQIVERERLQADRTAVLAADTARDSWANTALYDPEDGAFTKRGANALGVSQNVLAEFDDHVTQTAKSLRGERQQQAYLESSLQHRQNLQGSLNRFELQERTQYEDQTAQARVASAAESGALNYNDPASLKRSREDMLGTIAGQAAVRGWSEEQTHESSMRALGALHGGVIERMLADKRVGLAAKYLAGAKSELSADDQLKFSRAIEATQREGRNEYEAAIRGRISDLSASYKAGLTVPAGQELTPAQIDAAFPGKGAEIHGQLEADKRMGFDLKLINTQSPEEVAATVKKYDVQGGVGAAEGLQRQNEVVRAALASAKEREKNPAQFAVDNNLGYNALPKDPAGIAAELKNREAIRGGVSQKVGTAVPMLTPDEAKEIGTGLNAADADKAAQTFDFLRNTLGDQGYRAVMAQIAPDSPVKAYAGQIYGRRNPVTTKTHLFSPDEQTEQRIIAGTIVTGENIVNKSRAQKSEDGKPVKSLYEPDKALFDAAFTDSVGTAFAGNPDALELAQQSAYAYYVGRSAQTGRLNPAGEPIDGKLLQETMRAAVGEKVDFHGYGDVLPPLGYDSDAFENAVFSRFVAEMKTRGVSQEEATDAFPSLGVTNIRGQYVMTSGSQPFKLKGKPVIIDLNAPTEPLAAPEDAATKMFQAH